MPSDQLLLRADNLTAGYVPEVNILNGCSLELFDGELVGIIGPNGAGKSTLLKSMFGLIPIREGTVTLRGEDITSLKAHDLVQKGVGYVPQTNNVFQRLTVEENLQMGLYLAPKRFNERLEFVAGLFPLLGERRKQRAGSLSGGEQQMLAISRALMSRPRLLMVDELSMGLAPLVVMELLGTLRQLCDRGLGLIVVDQFASRLVGKADRGEVLEKGRIVFSGPISAAEEHMEGTYMGDEILATAKGVV